MTPLQRAIHQPQPIPSLALFRMLFGLMTAFSGIRFLAKGWVQLLYHTPTWHFTYPGFHWLAPLPGWGLYAVFAVMIAASLLMTVGLFYRTAAVTFFLTFTYIELLDRTYYLNHYVFVSLTAFLLILMPANRAWSLDVHFKRVAPQTHAPAWCINALRLQLGLVYIFAGLAKLNPDWLVHGQPLAIWLRVHAGLPIIGPIFDHPLTPLAMSWFGAAYDLTIPFFLLWTRTRPLAYAAVVIFHLATAALFNIGVFPWVMIVATTVYFSPTWPLKFMKRKGEPTKGSPPKSPPKALQVVLGVFFLLQILMPLRYLMYDGNVLWHERGFRFSWRVMLIEKTGHVDYYYQDPQTGARRRADIAGMLTPLQAKMMSTQPDMILQFAHYLAEWEQRKTGDRPKVFVESWVSFNGRPRARLIDPKVDLTSIDRVFNNGTWILPQPEPIGR